MMRQQKIPCFPLPATSFHAAFVFMARAIRVPYDAVYEYMFRVDKNTYGCAHPIAFQRKRLAGDQQLPSWAQVQHSSPPFWLYS